VIFGSGVASPKQTFVFEHIPEFSTQRDFARVLSQAETQAGMMLPIDTPSHARVIVTVRDGSVSLPSVHLREVATGAVLDQGRDVNATDLPAMHANDAQATQLAAQQPAFAAALALPRRILSIDAPMAPGRVMLEVPNATPGGVLVEVQQPDSAIVLSGAQREPMYASGNVAEVELQLADGAAPITNARFTATLELPNGERIAGPSVSAIAPGQYLARVPMSGADLKLIGVWHLHVKAIGTSRGVEFERDLDAGFSYVPSHARMVSAATPRISRGSDGKIDEIAVDVAVESLALDRVGLRGTLVHVDADGTERPIAEAQTGQVVQTGQSVITLHFAAKDLVLAQLDGPYLLRDLSLVSYAYSTTQHRLGRGLELTTPAFAASELRLPDTFSPAVQEILNLGAL
jgi:hypothetical protein